MLEELRDEKDPCEGGSWRHCQTSVGAVGLSRPDIWNLLSYKKERISVSSNEVDELGAYYTE